MIRLLDTSLTQLSSPKRVPKYGPLPRVLQKQSDLGTRKFLNTVEQELLVIYCAYRHRHFGALIEIKTNEFWFLIK
jgi:hypothetical protein